MDYFQNKRNHHRLGSLRADAFRGHGLSLLRSKERFLRGLRTRAIPVGVYVFCLRLHRLYDLWLGILRKIDYYSSLYHERKLL